jgi:hypothetical protein
MLEVVIVVLIVLWLLGYFGRTRIPALPRGNAVHMLLVIILILIVVRLLG